ncbi:MAG: DUF6391 domain-containing protein [Anaerolineales bacterium]|jgi:hypothetical protein
MSLQKSAAYQFMVNIPWFSRTRRNHGLEHATLHVLAKRFPGNSMAGHSDSKGFWLLGNIPTEEVESAVIEALERMKSGEKNLAVHPNCGTNFATAGTMAGVAGATAMFGVGPRKRDKLDRLALAATLATLALMVAQPTGLFIQKFFTTSGDPGGLEVVEISATQRGKLKAYRIITQG